MFEIKGGRRCVVIFLKLNVLFFDLDIIFLIDIVIIFYIAQLTKCGANVIDDLLNTLFLYKQHLLLKVLLHSNVWSISHRRYDMKVLRKFKKWIRYKDIYLFKLSSLKCVKLSCVYIQSK